MPSISGLATGIDSASIIADLLSIQTNQVDRFKARKAAVDEKKGAIGEIKDKLRAVQSAISTLTRAGTNSFLRKTVTSSDEESLGVSVSNQAATGVYSLRVNSLARNHQVASRIFTTADAAIASGDLKIQVGSAEPVTIKIDSSNSTPEGLARAINASGIDATATVVRRSNGYQLLLSSNESGLSNAITITETVASGGDANALPKFDMVNPVQAAANAEVQIGTGANAIKLQSESNTADDLFTGVTLNLKKEDPNKEITFTVGSDNEASKEAINDFVTSYNELIDLMDQQSQVNVVTGEQSPLYGVSSVRQIRDRLIQTVSGSVANVNSKLNSFGKIGIKIDTSGKLSVDDARLTEVLEGRDASVSFDDIKRLFGNDATTNNPAIQFVLSGPQTVATSNTEKGFPYMVRITRAAEQATVTATNTLATSTVIDATNDTFSVKIDSREFTNLQIKHGTYTADQLAGEVENAINNQSPNGRRLVQASLDAGRLKLTSLAYGSASNIKVISGSALTATGLTANQTDSGVDVSGSYYYVDKRTGNWIEETATGRGQNLISDRVNSQAKEGTPEAEKNQLTAGLQLRVTITASEIQSGPVSSQVTVTKGIASELNTTVDTLLRTTGASRSNGVIANVEEQFKRQTEDIDRQIKRMTDRFNAAQKSLVEQFTRLETSVSDLQSLGNLLGAQLGSLPQINSR